MTLIRQIARLAVAFFTVVGPLPLQAVDSFAQAPTFGDCETGEAEALLDVGAVRAPVSISGTHFWNRTIPYYEIPIGSGVSALGPTSLLVGGLVDGDVRTAATTYGPFEFWPGPIPEGGSPPTDCDRFDRIYSIRGEGVHSDGSVQRIAGDVESWPVHLGAPYVERGGSPDTYEPEEGDYPELLGEQMHWWVMNDLGNRHQATEEEPLGIEIRASAFAFGSVSGLRNHTFYRYQIRNRSDRPIRSMYVGLYHDVNLGAAFDDYVGSDSSTGLAYFYNADDHDDGNYGSAPPAVGFTVLHRPVSTIDRQAPACTYSDHKGQGLTSHVQIRGGGGRGGFPENGQHFYNLMQGLWKDESPVREGGHGLDVSGSVVKFAYPGDPVAGGFWSEMNTDGDGASNQPSDRRSASGVGPFCLGPGDETEVVFAILWARGDSNLDSVTQLRAVARGVQEVATDLLEPNAVELRQPQGDLPSTLSAAIYPNPAAEQASIRLGVPQSIDVRIDVFDALGRRVQGVVNDRLDAGDRRFTLPTSDWSPGVYLVRIQLDQLMETRRLVISR